MSVSVAGGTGQSVVCLHTHIIHPDSDVFHGVGESGDAETPIVHVKSLSITPDPPVAGQNLTVLAEADVTQQITVSLFLPTALCVCGLSCFPPINLKLMCVRMLCRRVPTRS